MSSQAKTANPVIFPIAIPWKDVQVAYRRRLDELAAQAEIKGFRKGKAPRAIVEEKIGQKTTRSSDL